MDTKCTRTFEVLENFIQSQKTFLERTYADIDRLKEFRKDVETDSSLSIGTLAGKLNNPSFRLSEQVDAMPLLPEGIDWSLFNGADTTPFKALAATAREAYTMRNVPPKRQLTAPSALRQFVATKRVSVVDPILNMFRLPPDLAVLSSDDEAMDPEELRRAHEREKIWELKKRRIEGDADVPLIGGLGLRKPVAGVFIRQDQDDESGEVDISMAEEGGAPSSMAGYVSETASMAVDTARTSIAPPESLPQLPMKRERRPSRKAQAQGTAVPMGRTKAITKAKAQAKRKGESDEDLEESTTSGPPATKNAKAKSETYKQAWSVSEQHLLERLLEEIPDGEKNRWAKISKAMNGRRTARQVASRVQKYYEKLKRFGIEVGGSKNAAAV